MNYKVVLIQEKLLDELKPKLEHHNQGVKDWNLGKEKNEKKSRLKLDALVLFVSLINSTLCSYRDDDSGNDGIVRLNSTRMKKAYHDKYSTYMEFLVKEGFIWKVSEGSAKAHRSSEFCIVESYRNDKLVEYKILDKTLIKRMSDNVYLDEEKEKKGFCKHIRPHLVKCFNEHFKIDEEAAEKEIESLSTDYSDNEYSPGKHSINDFSKGYFTYSIDPRTDNRLHSTLTRTPKVIRKHIYYNGENILGLDVKTSQAYFFCAILKAILKKDESLLEQINATKILDDKLVFKLFNLEMDRKEVENFVLSVLDHNKDFYESFSKKIDITHNEEGLPIRLESNYKKKRKSKEKEAYSIVPYDNERALAKGAIMEIFYSCPNTKIKEAAVFRKEYPSISKILKCIKDYGVEFWRLLDYVEAYCLLDYAALKFAENHPDIFITSIHDCLVTVKSSIALLEEEIKQYLMDVTTLKIPPKFEIETWQ